jgi:two-component system CheB/CheR fusion protein
MPADRPPPNPTATRIVGIGASAGGLDALERFLASVPADSGLAYVVVQHLDPTHKAMLTELLQRVTAMPVREALASMRVEPGTVYVIPPNAELTVAAGVLHLAPPSQRRGMRLPIDVLFASLARDQGERAIGVVLSGMGSDGTLGLQAIKSLGGLTLVQQPQSAHFDAMPRSAIDSGCADIVAPPAELALRIAQIGGAHAQAAPPTTGDDAADLGVILSLLREHSKHDLSLYKPTTLRRRIERRIGVHRLASMAEYAGFVRDNPLELDLLFKEMLIGVTSFFRDPPVWQEFAATVLPNLLRRAGAGARLRAWVVGCSTGEEAYSLAMLFNEASVRAPGPDPPHLQIFATDVNADAIAFARRGLYPAGIVADVGPARLAQHFTAQGDGYLVSKALREMVLFAQQDVLLDPPFTRLDILSCRNLMIYFSATLQRRLIPLFHYSLRSGGVLLLGGSETIGRAQRLFTPLDLKSRFYQRSDSGGDAGPVDFPVQRRWTSRSPTQESNVTIPMRPPGNLQSLAEQVVLQEFAPAAVLVGPQGDIVYISGRTGRYLEPAAGKANWNIHAMARPGIRSQLVGALRQAALSPGPIELHGLHVEDGPQTPVDVSVKAMTESTGLAGMLMIVFRETPIARGRKARRRLPAGAVDPALAEELARVQAEVQALRQEMRASAEELQAANEELQSTNEELQSANEELTTSKEEAQSMNEELQTINAELQSKLDDLALAQSDMQNLLNSMDIATLFLDNDLNVRRFTEQMTRIIHLRDGDVGRPLSELASTLSYPELHADARETLRTLAFSEKQRVTTDGHWYSVRIMPYRTVANVIQGVVITFVDITATKELESRLRAG